MLWLLPACARELLWGAEWCFRSQLEPRTLQRDGFGLLRGDYCCLGQLQSGCSHDFKTQAQNKSTSQDLWASESSLRDWGCSSHTWCIARGWAAPDPSPVLMSNGKFCTLLNWVCWSTLKPHLKYFIPLQQAPGLLGSAVISVLDALHQPAVGLCQVSTALLQLLNSIFLQIGQILHAFVD